MQCDGLGGQQTPATDGQSEDHVHIVPSPSAHTAIVASLQTYCYEMKVIQAFSWMIFAVCKHSVHLSTTLQRNTSFFSVTISFMILLALVTRAQTLGRPDIWYEPIRTCSRTRSRVSSNYFLEGELPWFGEWPGYYNTHTGMMPQYPGYPMMQYPGGGQYVQSVPGQSIVIQPGTNGQPATVTHI